MDLGDWGIGVDGDVMLELERPLTDDERASLEHALSAWSDDGVGHVFGIGHLHGFLTHVSGSVGKVGGSVGGWISAQPMSVKPRTNWHAV